MVLPSTSVPLPSGFQIDLGESLDRFCREEWPYYDGIPDRDPSRVLPDDVLATVAMNSYITNAAQVRAIHQGLARKCDRLLERIPVEADLEKVEAPYEPVLELLDAACSVRGVLVPVATKVFHRKRRSLIPMLDNVILFGYLDALGRKGLKARTQEGPGAAKVATFVLDAFRRDLIDARSELERAESRLAGIGKPMTRVRILEVSVWIAIEERGYYRAQP